MRPTTATEVARELRILVNFWHSSAADLTGSIELNSEKAHTELDNDKRMQFARRARSALDIAIRCQLVFPAKVQEQLEAIENILKLGDPLQYGQDLLTQGKYKKAREELEKAKHWSEDPAVARHWVYTAHIGEEVSDPIFSKYQSQLFDLIETLNQANWGEAEILLSELSKSPLASTTGLKAMQAEYDLFSQKNEAERLKGQGDYEQAANCFRKAQEALGKLPDREFVDQEELGGTLLPLIEEMELKQRTVGRAKAILAETKQELRNLYN
jgi:tetratricopeptide (TPR) repeat protein